MFLKVFKNKTEYIFSVIEILFVSWLSTINVFADNSDAFSVDFLKDSSSNDVFGEATNGFKAIFSSGYSLAATVCIAITAFCIMGAGIRFMMGGRKKEEAKDQFLGILIGAVIVFGSLSIVTLFIAIGQSLDFS